MAGAAPMPGPSQTQIRPRRKQSLLKAKNGLDKGVHFNLLFLSGMLPTEGRTAKFTGRMGAELNVDAARQAARLAALNALAVARHHLGSLDLVTRIVRLGVLVATSGDVRDQPKVADAASALLQDVFGRDKNPSRLVYGVASLPLGTPVELELIFEVAVQSGA